MSSLLESLRRRTRTVDVPGGQLTLTAPDTGTYKALLSTAADMQDTPGVDSGFDLACKCLVAVLPDLKDDEDAAAEVLIGTGGVAGPLARAAIEVAGIAPEERVHPDDVSEGELGNS